MLHQPVKFLRQWRPRNERKGIDVQPIFSLSLPETNDILQMERRNHDRRFPIGVNHPELKNSGARLSHSRSGLGYLKSREREREREDRSLYGVGSRSPVSRKRERHRKKLARVEWYAAAIVPRETVSHIIQLYFYWKMKKEGGRRQAGRQVSPGKRRSPLSQRGYAPIILCLIWFHGLRAATGISSVYSYSCIYGQVDCLSNFLRINDEN